MTGTQTHAHPVDRRRWIGLAVLALPTLLLSLDVSVLVLALPHLAADLGADSVAQLWILDIYSFVLAGFLVTMGTLGDRIGRRRLLLIGGACFGVASIIAAFSPTTELLIASRALLGVAGATLMPSTLALIRNMFPNPAHVVPLSALVAGLGFGVVFVRRQQRLRDPLLDLGLFRYRAFSTALGVNLLLGVVMAGVSFVTTVYLQRSPD